MSHDRGCFRCNRDPRDYASCPEVDCVKIAVVKHQKRYSGAHGKEIGKVNLARVRLFFETHLCATQAECANTLQLSTACVARHVKTLRSEWSGRS
jgi:hypothetical protein